MIVACGFGFYSLVLGSIHYQKCGSKRQDLFSFLACILFAVLEVQEHSTDICSALVRAPQLCHMMDSFMEYVCEGEAM